MAGDAIWGGGGRGGVKTSVGGSRRYLGGWRCEDASRWQETPVGGSRRYLGGWGGGVKTPVGGSRRQSVTGDASR